MKNNATKPAVEQATNKLTAEQKNTLVISREVEENGKKETQSVELVLAHLYDKMEVAKKIEFLREQKKILNSFSIGDSRINTSITIKDHDGRAWTTANGFLLQEIFTVCRKIVDEKIKDAEVELLAA